MSVGLPSLVSDISANNQLVGEGHGVRTKVGDIAGIASGLLSLLEDPVKRSHMGIAARSRILEYYTIDCVAARHERLYLSLLE